MTQPHIGATGLRAICSPGIPSVSSDQAVISRLCAAKFESAKQRSKIVAAWGQVETKVLRGGGWNNNWNNVRAANRNNNTPTNRNNNIGFRCAGVAPGEFLKGQVHPVHGRDASAEREKVQSKISTCSRLGLLFLQWLNQRCRRLCRLPSPCVVDVRLTARDSTLRAGGSMVNKRSLVPWGDYRI